MSWNVSDTELKPHLTQQRQTGKVMREVKIKSCGQKKGKEKNSGKAKETMV